MGGPGSGGRAGACEPGCSCGRHVKPRGADSPNYVGDKITHKAMHARVIRVRGAARSHRCFFHAERDEQVPACDWAQIHETTGLHIADYIALCRRCHIRYDGRPNNGKHKPTAEARAKMSVSALGRHRNKLGRFVAVLVLGLFAALAVHPAPASASTGYAGARMLNWAEADALNRPYEWGATGPYAYDCSGLVYAAATSTGERNWPRDTYGIAAQIGSRFSVTSHPQRGDLAMWGSYSSPYHVELVTIWYQTTFGAETYGWAGRVTWHYDGWFRPSFYLHINW